MGAGQMPLAARRGHFLCYTAGSSGGSSSHPLFVARSGHPRKAAV